MAPSPFSKYFFAENEPIATMRSLFEEYFATICHKQCDCDMSQQFCDMNCIEVDTFKAKKYGLRGCALTPEWSDGSHKVLLHRH